MSRGTHTLIIRIVSSAHARKEQNKLRIRRDLSPTSSHPSELYSTTTLLDHSVSQLGFETRRVRNLFSSSVLARENTNDYDSVPPDTGTYLAFWRGRALEITTCTSWKCTSCIIKSSRFSSLGEGYQPKDPFSQSVKGPHKVDEIPLLIILIIPGTLVY